jgi:NhaP-type Na+/H+ or K+/H+ antiporter
VSRKAVAESEGGVAMWYNKNMKRTFYIFCFVVLGIILQQIIHTVIEMVYIKLLISDFKTYGFGWTWETWFMIHHVLGVLLLLAGIAWGYFMGRRCWVYLYDEKGNLRRRKKFFGKLYK